MILSLDWEKAFDKVATIAIEGALTYFKFSNLIRKWTQILYRGFTVRIQNNGHFSEPINVERSVHQGGVCVDSILFIECGDASNKYEKKL